MGKDVHNKMAQFAFERVSKIDSNKKEFRSLARSMPSIIQINGLGAAVAFLCTKKKAENAHEKMYGLLKDWLNRKECLLPEKREDLMECITNLDSDAYRLYTNETMNICLWVKRFAEGMIDGGEGNE